MGLANLARESFWEGGLPAVEAPNPEQAVDAPATESRMETEEEDWEKEVLGALESLSSVVVEEGYVQRCATGVCADEGRRPDAGDPFHVSQLHIILDRTDKLLEAFASSLQEGEYDTSLPQ